ncbi:hypothetical protein DPMN_087234, partial [Dreissena polymorpha]
KFGVAKTGEQCQKKNQNSKARFFISYPVRFVPIKFGVAKTGEQCQKKNQNSKARSSSYALQSSERATTASSEEHMSVPVMKVEALSVKNRSQRRTTRDHKPIP